MDQYEACLTAMKRLLNLTDQTYWADWIGTDIQRWHDLRDTSHHLSAYGGMGSLNDVCLTHPSGQQGPWADTLLDWLRSVSYFLARHPDRLFAADELAQAVGRLDAALSAFVGGDKAPPSLRADIGQVPQLQGWRCLRCGHSEVIRNNIQYLSAGILLPRLVFHSCEHRVLDRLVDQVLAGEIPDVVPLRQRITEAVKASGIGMRDQSGWMRPCPVCGTEDTAVYRWDMKAQGRGYSFRPSATNLPLRT